MCIVLTSAIRELVGGRKFDRFLPHLAATFVLTGMSLYLLEGYARVGTNNWWALPYVAFSATLAAVMGRVGLLGRQEDSQPRRKELSDEVAGAAESPLCEMLQRSEEHPGEACATQQQGDSGPEPPRRASAVRAEVNSNGNESAEPLGWSRLTFRDRFGLLWTIGNVIALGYCVATGDWEWFFAGILASAVAAVLIDLVVECLASGLRIGIGKLVSLVGGGVAMVSGASTVWCAMAGLSRGYTIGSAIAFAVGLLASAVGVHLAKR